MLNLSQYNPISVHDKVDAENGIIFGVCVMSKGEAKGHGLMLDDKSLDGFIELTKSRPNGVGTRFGDDHDAGAQDFNGTLKNFRRDGDKVRADFYLLKTDKNYDKLLEMAKAMPHEFGLSASTTAMEELIGNEKFVRFTEINCVDVVTKPASTKGLFFSTKTNNNTMTKQYAVLLGLPDTASEQEILVALEAKCKMDAEAKKKMEGKEKKHEEDADGDAEGESESKKKFAAIEAKLTELSAKLVESEKANAEKAAALELSAKKAAWENIKAEASREGKVIPLTDESALKLSEKEQREIVANLPKGKVNLGQKKELPAEIKKGSPEHKAYLVQLQDENARIMGEKLLTLSK